MAATTSTGLFIPAHMGSDCVSPANVIPRVVTNRRRRITPEAGHALEILGHAIEYLTDELVHDGVLITAHNERVQAVQLLMALNRQVYFECPEEPTFGERFRAFLRAHFA